MGLFDQVVGAIANPSQQANAGQLGGILSAVGQLATSQQADASSTQGVMSVVGNVLRSSLRDRRESEGAGAVQALVQQFAGTDPNPDAVSALLSPDQQSEVVQQASASTGLNAGAIQSMLPVAVPLVLNLLQSGGQNSGGQGGGGLGAIAGALAGAAGGNEANDGSNSVLSAFLDADGDGDVDIADALSMAGKFMSNQGGLSG